MADRTYQAEVQLTRGPGHDRFAWLPGGQRIGFPGRSGPSADAPPASTSEIDHLVAATSSCMLATFARALEAQGIAVDAGGLEATAVGEAESEARVLVLRSIHVTYHLAPEEGADLGLVEQVLAVHTDASPVFRGISPQVRVTAELRLADAAS